MNIARLLGFRPKSEKTGDIAAAISAAEEAHAAALARIDEIEAGRPALLAGGSEAEIVAAETELASARTEAEQLAALAVGLAPRLTMAKHAEAVIALRKLNADAAEAEDRFVRWMGEEYAKHARAIGAGMEIETEALEHQQRLYVAMNAAPDAARELGLAGPVNPAAKVYPGLADTSMMQVRYLVKLPPPAGPTGENGAHDWRWITRRPEQP